MSRSAMLGFPSDDALHQSQRACQTEKDDRQVQHRYPPVARANDKILAEAAPPYNPISITVP